MRDSGEEILEKSKDTESKDTEGPGSVCPQGLHLSLNFFAMRHQEPELRYILKSGTMGFGWAQVPGERKRGAEGWEKKAMGKTCQRIPFIICQKIC